MPASKRIPLQDAEIILARYTLAATSTGAIPVPAASTAIVAQNAAMLAHLSRVMGRPISAASVIESFSTLAALNLVGRTLFVEGARLLSWGTGSVWAAGALCVLGGFTAGLQTYIIGRLAIEIAINDGAPMSGRKGNRVIDEAKATYSSFVEAWKAKPPPTRPQ